MAQKPDFLTKGDTKDTEKKSKKFPQFTKGNKQTSDGFMKKSG